MIESALFVPSTRRIWSEELSVAVRLAAIRLRVSRLSSRSLRPDWVFWWCWRARTFDVNMGFGPSKRGNGGDESAGLVPSAEDPGRCFSPSQQIAAAALADAV